MRNKINDFMSKGVYNESLSTDNVKYYKVESNEDPGYTMDNDVMLPGILGDILVSPNTHVFNEFISSIVSFNVGGHASIVTDYYRDAEIMIDDKDSIESDYYNEINNPAEISYRSYWNDTIFFDEVIGLRADLTEEQKNEVLSVASGHLGDPYNTSFIFDTKNKSYCSDLITKVYSTVGINTNKDGYVTTVLDIITTKELHITYYHYHKDNVKYIYYV